jgi:UDP-perosamine 4-acetyltransferase
MSRPRLVILGSGGHAKVIAEIFEESSSFEIAGFTALSPTETLFDYPYLGNDSQLAQLLTSGITYAFPAIGSNRIRRRVLAELRQLGFSLPNAISRNAILSPRTKLGVAVAILPGAVVNTGSTIGDGAILNTSSSIDHDNHIGACAHIAPGCHLAGNVTVGEGAFLAAASAAIPGVTIGPWATVGAGGVVIRDITAGVTVVGVPASRLLR